MRELESKEVVAIVDLARWRGPTRPRNDRRADVAFARASRWATVLLHEQSASLVTAVLVGHDGHRGAVCCVGVALDRRGVGHGWNPTAAAEDWPRAPGGCERDWRMCDDNAGAMGSYAALGHSDQHGRVPGRRLDDRAPSVRSGRLPR